VAQPVIGLVPLVIVVFTRTAFDGAYSRATFVTGRVHGTCAAHAAGAGAGTKLHLVGAFAEINSQYYVLFISNYLKI
jgi:hypothetical protein